LLREGLDLPEVSLVAILDADKEGFLRSTRSLTQTAGRAARNVNGKVIMYADRITDSMKMTIDQTNRRREKQLAYNIENNITPTQIYKSTDAVMGHSSAMQIENGKRPYVENTEASLAADPVLQYMNKDQLGKAIMATRRQMEKAAKDLEFLDAARLRDELFMLQKRLDDKD